MPRMRCNQIPSRDKNRDISLTELAQRPPCSAPAVRATAENLPLATDSVDATLAVLTAHHWDDLSRGLNLAGGVQANLAIAVYGLVLILLMPLAPRGIMGALERVTGFWKERSRGDELRAESGDELRKEESVR